MPHQHEPKHWPATGTGYAVCECGATLRIVKNEVKGTWHACELCVAGYSQAPSPKTR